MTTPTTGLAVMGGGRGTRLQPAIGPVPKLLAPFAGTTLLEHQLARFGPVASDVAVLVAARDAALVRAQVPGRITWIVEEVPLGTAGGLVHLPTTPDRWIVVNVDHVSDVAPEDLLAATPAPCTAVLFRKRVTLDEGVVEVVDGCVTSVRERPEVEILVTTGLYVFSREALASHLDGTPLDMPDLVARLLPGGGVHAFIHAGTWLDAGTPERWREAQRWYLSSLAGVARP